MSSYMTRLEMDDVLSSIRKLVSETPRQEDGFAEESSLFVLTPAHRVEDNTADIPQTLQAAPNQGAPEAELPPLGEQSAPSEAQEPPMPAAEAEGDASQAAAEDRPEAGAEEATAPDLSSEPIDLKSRIARLEQAVGRTDEQFEPDGSEPQEEEMPELHFLEQYRRRFTPMPADLRTTPEPEEPRGEEEPLQLGDVAIFTHRPRPGDATPDAAADVAEAEAPAEEAEEALAEAADEPVEVSQTAEAAEAADDADTAETVAELIEDPVAEQAEPETGAEPESVAEEPAPEIAFAHRRAPDAEVEAAQPDAEAEDVPEEPILAETVEEAQAAEEPAASEVVELFDEAGGEVWDRDDEMLVDEDMLRKIVADIVRDELQGRLGERITRNVRRMVRREIEKAVTIKSIE